MRKEVRPSSNSQRASRSVGQKKISVQKGIKRAASTNLKEEVKKRKTNNSSGILIGGLEEVSSSRRESSGHVGEQSVKAKKKIVTVKINCRRVINKKPVEDIKGKKLRVKNDTSKLVLKQKQKKAVVLSGKKTLKLKLKAVKSSSISVTDKGQKDGKHSVKKSVDKMGKAVGKKTPDSSPDRRVSETQHDSEPHKKQNKNKTTVKTVISTKVSKISNVRKAEKPVKKPSKKGIQKVKDKPGIPEDNSKSSNSESKVSNKKGVSGRRKSTNKPVKSLETSPSRSPSIETSPVKSKSSDKVTEKPAVKGKRPEKKATKEKDQSKPSKAEIEKEALTEIHKTSSDIKNVCTNAALGTVGTDDVKKKQPLAKEDSIKSNKESSKVKEIESKPEEQICDQKSQLDVKCMPPKKLIKQKVEIEHEMKVKKAKQAEEDLGDNIKLESHDDVNNDSSTSDEIPLNEIMKRSIFKQETDCKSEGELKSNSKSPSESISNSPKVEEDKRHQSSPGEKEEMSLVQDNIPDEKTSNVKSKKETVPEKKSKCIKDDQPKKMPEKNGKKDLKLKKELKSTLKSKESTEKKAVKQKVAKLVKKSKLGDVRNRQKSCNVAKNKSSDKSDSDSRAKRLKLFGFWNGPKRHRVASLNALAKVHCLYENESRTALLEMCDSSSSNTTQSYSNKTQPKKADEKPKESPETKDPPTHTRTLRSAPGLRAPGRHWDMLNVSTTSPSTTSEDSCDAGEDKKLTLQPSVKQKQSKKPENYVSSCSSEEDNKTSSKTTKTEEDNTAGNKQKVKKKRKRHELMMDLKDMVVRKRMASLNASAILAASYSVEKRSVTKKDDGDEDQKKKKEAAEKKNTKKRPVESSPDMEVEDSSEDDDVIVRSTNSKSKPKVAVIVNQDTDVTITGVYVNSTTRSTHHEGFCSIAGMQYRISSTSHTQTEATAVSTETVLHTEHPTSGHRIQETTPPATVSTHAVPPPCKSYTPLDALSSMQPPGHHHSQPSPRTAPLSPIGRRHGCSSAFTAPPNYGPHQPPPAGPPQVQQQDPGYIHGYYQPAGPLISTHHHHHHSTSSSSSSVTSKLPQPSGPAPNTLPTPTPPPSSAPHPASESSDNEVIITATSSESNPPPISYRYPTHPTQPYSSYNYQYYPSPPATANLQYPAPQQTHYHQEICYSTTPSSYPPPPGYFHHKSGPYPPPSYHRRYGPPPQYYSQDFYANPPNPNSNPPLPPSQQQMIVTAPTGTSSTSFPPPDSGYPPPPAPMVDSYPPPPPPTYYPAYGTGPPPPCYSHSPPSRSLAFIDAYQSCPCPMQSCPKNVLTGPLTGASKGSIKNHQTTPLPPVALALPLEPPGALGPPSPARGSAGMPPPPSPALATARNPTNGQWSESPSEMTKPPVEPKTETGLLAISKVLSESVMVTDQDIGSVENTIVAMSFPKTENVKIEVEDSVFHQESNEVKPNRKRKKCIKTMPDCKKQITEIYNENTEIKMQMDIQERLKVPVEKLEISDVEKPVEKQLPLSDNGATVPVKKQLKKRKSTEEENQEPLPKMAKCEKSKVCEKPCDKVKMPKVQQVGKKKCVKRDKSVTEENIEPVETDSNVKVSEVGKVHNRRRSSKSTERRKSSSSPQESRVVESPVEVEFPPPTSTAPKKKKTLVAKKAAEKTNEEHTVKSQAVSKERRNSKNGKGNAKETLPGRNVRKITVLEENSEDVEIFIAPAPRKLQLTPKWSNGWSWEGQPFKSKVFLSSDDAPIIRKCYPSMRHVQGDIICPYDCVLLKSGPRKTDLPFVAKVAAMWENPDDGEMMVSLLWYYRPEHTEQGRRPEDTPDEIFASRHKDTNSVACIEDKCFVLTFNEYCRYRKNVKRIEEGCSTPPRVVPLPDGGMYPRNERQPPGQVAPDLVFFCRRVYDFRQKRILKNPC